MPRSAAALLCLAASAPVFAQAYSVLHAFSARSGGPASTLTVASDGKLYGTLTGGGEYGLGAAFVLTPDGAGGYSYAELHGAVPGDGARGFSSGLLEASDGQFYGATYFPQGGTIYRVSASGGFAVIHTFTGSEGTYPVKPIQPTGTDLYGAATLPNGATLFRMDTAGNLTILHVFSAAEGVTPGGPLLYASDGLLYGVAELGGQNNLGTIYRSDLAGNVTVVHHFADSEGAYPQGALIQAGDGVLYGTTSGGGAFGAGTIFRLETDGTFETLYSLGSEGSTPAAELLPGSDGNLYGTTAGGGAAGGGTVFRITTGGSFSTLHDLLPEDGTRPYAGLVEAGGSLVGVAYSQGPGGLGTVYALDPELNLHVVHGFSGAEEGELPSGVLAQAADGAIYGTAVLGGSRGFGTIFRLDSSGMTVVHDFHPVDGGRPQGGLLASSGDVLYGTASSEGQFGKGTIFRCTPQGAFEKLHDFDGVDGDEIYDGLVEASDGRFYGSTRAGGAAGLGTVYRVDSSGGFETLHEFDGSDGIRPAGDLIQASDGNLYGVTYGYYPDPGSIYRMDLSGEVSVLHTLGGAEGSGPLGTLFQGSDGLLWGATGEGGEFYRGTVFNVSIAGDVSVAAQRHGDDGPALGGLVEGPDGYLWGVTFGNKLSKGTVFRVGIEGDLTIAHRFNGADGASPQARLLAADDGYLYGIAQAGALGGGVVFRIDPAAVLSVSAVSPAGGPASGGTPATITGANFQPGADVLVGPVEASDIVVGGSTEIAVTMPQLPAGAAYDVVVGNPDGVLATRKRAWVTDAVDVPESDPYHDDVVNLLRNGVTVGCGDGAFCVDATVSRAQMAVFMLKAKLGPAYQPPAASGAVFLDVPADAFAAAWIEDLATRGIVVGCGAGNYCPDSPVTRAQMSVLLLRTLLGPSYSPPLASGAVFDDVPAAAFAAAWIEDLASRGITAGCHAGPPLFCPGAANTRGQMSAFLVRTFGLP